MTQIIMGNTLCISIVCFKDYTRTKLPCDIASCWTIHLTQQDHDVLHSTPRQTRQTLGFPANISITPAKQIILNRHFPEINYYIFSVYYLQGCSFILNMFLLLIFVVIHVSCYIFQQYYKLGPQFSKSKFFFFEVLEQQS